MLHGTFLLTFRTSVPHISLSFQRTATPIESVKQLLQKRFLAVLLIPVMGISVAITLSMAVCIGLRLWCLLTLWRRSRCLWSRSFEDLVEFPPVQPDTPAFRAIVDFNTLAVRHDEIDGGTYGTFHAGILLLWLIFTGDAYQEQV
jgi:hypothetical protein